MDQFNQLKREIAQNRYEQAAQEAKKRRLAAQVFASQVGTEANSYLHSGNFNHGVPATPGMDSMGMVGHGCYVPSLQTPMTALHNGVDPLAGTSNNRQPANVFGARSDLAMMLDSQTAPPTFPHAADLSELVAGARRLPGGGHDNPFLSTQSDRPVSSLLRGNQTANAIVRSSLLFNQIAPSENNGQLYTRLSESMRVQKERASILNKGAFLGGSVETNGTFRDTTPPDNNGQLCTRLSESVIAQSERHVLSNGAFRSGIAESSSAREINSSDEQFYSRLAESLCSKDRPTPNNIVFPNGFAESSLSDNATNTLLSSAILLEPRFSRRSEPPNTSFATKISLEEQSVFDALSATTSHTGTVNAFCLAQPRGGMPGTTAAMVPGTETQANQDYIPLGIEEDNNWLSEMHCFLRSEIVEVFYAEKYKVAGRSNGKGLSTQQVGIRCRWCVNTPADSRVCRSSAFPSSLRQLYQSFTMMVRDHFGPTTMCQAIPTHLRDRLNHLRCSRVSQGASDSKHYWIYAANKIGMVDTPNEGIKITSESRAEGLKMPTFGSPSVDKDACIEKPAPLVLLVKPNDLSKTTMFLYTLLLQTQSVQLQPSERVAKRKTLPLGLEGIGCRHCCAAKRYGFSRRFPLRRRCLPEEVKDIHCHIMRCPLCPREVKDMLEKLHVQHEAETLSATRKLADGRNKDPHKEFFDLIWARLGRRGDIKT
ncbi:expressed unknown protein [Seminavis robusta]|uniref:Uncharacterized protein n=1 Tax=Seminavis robusta TaxID=568900 RepID=A0A9N8D5W8_9STRA|nr:expressed unknown protein [Seminavis robusta]|eukprot:Sro12_g009570.1 n/a (709) ;mRNA; r:154045-156256